MNGFGASATPFLWFMALWTAIGLLFLLAASALWRRAPARASSARSRRTQQINRRRPRRDRHRPRRVHLLQHQHPQSLDVDAPRRSIGARITRRPTAPPPTMPRPHIAAITADVALYPNERRYHVTGNYDLVNDGATPIANVLVSVPRDARVTTLTIPTANGHSQRTIRHLRRFNSRIRSNRASARRCSSISPTSIAASPQRLPTPPSPRTAPSSPRAAASRSSATAAATRSAIRSSGRNADCRHPRERRRPIIEDLGVEWTNVDVTLSTAPDQIALAPDG